MACMGEVLGQGVPKRTSQPHVAPRGGEPCLSMSRSSGVPFDKPSSLINPRSWLRDKHGGHGQPRTCCGRIELIWLGPVVPTGKDGVRLGGDAAWAFLGVCSALQIRPPPWLIATIVGGVV